MLYTRYAYKIYIRNKGKSNPLKILITFPFLFQTTNTFTKIAKKIAAGKSKEIVLTMAVNYI